MHAHRGRGLTAPVGLLVDLAGRVATFLLLPIQIARMADEDGRARPIDWQVGRAPFGWALGGLFLWYRVEHDQGARGARACS